MLQISKKCGEAWKNIDEKKKKKDEKMQEEAKAKFEKDMKAFMENGGEAAMAEAKSKTQEKKAKKAAKMQD